MNNLKAVQSKRRLLVGDRSLNGLTLVTEMPKVCRRESGDAVNKLGVEKHGINKNPRHMPAH